MSDYEKVLNYIRRRCEDIRGEWDGDSAGEQEDNASSASELLELLAEVDRLVKELDI